MEAPVRRIRHRPRRRPVGRARVVRVLERSGVPILVDRQFADEVLTALHRGDSRNSDVRWMKNCQTLEPREVRRIKCENASYAVYLCYSRKPCVVDLHAGNTVLRDKTFPFHVDGGGNRATASIPLRWWRPRPRRRHGKGQVRSCPRGGSQRSRIQ